MAESTFRGMINFLGQVGIYDVVLPFLLVFTIVFAILEKTKILGVEKYQGETYTKKQLNAITSFVIAFLVIASTRLVALINEALANTVILLIFSVMFLLLIGSFYREGEDVFLQGGWRTFFTWLMFVAIVLIFLRAVRTSDNQSWLEWFWGFLKGNWKNEWVASLIFIVVVIVFMYFIVGGKDRGNGKSSGNGNSGHGGAH